VEGGTYTLQRFINAQLCNEAIGFKTAKHFDKGISTQD
jgi:hypothetical protein